MLDFVFGVDRFTPSSFVLKSLNWQLIEQRIKYHKCIMVYKILNNRVPSYLDYLVIKRDVCYNTRYAVNSPLFVPIPPTQYMKTLFSYQGSAIFNSLPCAT